MADKGLVVFLEGTSAKRDTGDWWQKEPLELEESQISTERGTRDWEEATQRVYEF